MIHYYTSITSNYLPKARILARSIRKHDPDAVIHLVLCDRLPATVDFAQEPFDHLIQLEDLDIPDLQRWLFKHDVVELCTAAKGPAMHKLLNRPDAEQVYFFDPDIVVFGELESLHGLLADASVLLTPHQIVPEKQRDAIVDNEICSLKHGIYNLGFVGVRKCDAGLAFAKWWRERLLSWCYADIPNGLFTDQRWCDLVPALFADVKILRDPRFNVATWNLTNRKVALGPNGQLQVEGQPLGFFHFSGFDSGAQKVMLEKYAPGNATVFELHDWYVREMDKEGQAELGRTPWAYASYADGVAIPRIHRYIYRSRPDLISAYKDPFAVGTRSLRAAMERDYPTEAELRAGVATEQTLFAVTALRNTLAWRIGYALTNPVERVLSRVPGLVPSIKRALRA